MRTNVEIDDELMERALSLTGIRTKREVIERALETLVRLREQDRLRELRGKLVWEDDLDRMRGAD